MGFHHRIIHHHLRRSDRSSKWMSAPTCRTSLRQLRSTITWHTSSRSKVRIIKNFFFHDAPSSYKYVELLQYRRSTSLTYFYFFYVLLRHEKYYYIYHTQNSRQPQLTATEWCQASGRRIVRNCMPLRKTWKPLDIARVVYQLIVRI